MFYETVKRLTIGSYSTSQERALVTSVPRFEKKQLEGDFPA